MIPTTIPDSIKPIFERYDVIEKKKHKAAHDAAVGRPQLADAQADLAEAQHGDPSDPAAAKRLADAIIAEQLFRNHVAKCEKLQAEATDEARPVVAAFGRELIRLGLEAQRGADSELVEHIASQTNASTTEIGTLFAMRNIRTKAAQRGYELEMEARSAMDEARKDEPFRAWSKMLTHWTKYATPEQS